ncbi:glutathione synthase [Galdieria sulphuraria]|uniref:Glutathione synthetase n=1 Tax=Galdieria sulphuraria TaxID=130081 RepID=M2W3W5_GALSU|nr:glutathione synthase [Galdieria sulphuraria]EME30421.1 glutathione synthase [Galdieria sulphuraria]|eukprot:XP_005706941.1 glutathione synthase [Galdieria sulphuraria]
MNDTKEKNSKLVHSPFALFPSVVPKDCFELACKLAPVFNLLAFRLSNCPEYLLKHLEALTTIDEFSGKLVLLYKETVQHFGRQPQPYQLGILRSDYFIDVLKEKSTLKQIELNTIASSFAALGQRVAEWHQVARSLFDKSQANDGELPPIRNVQNFVEAMKEAHTIYDDAESRILFVVQPNERNTYDQEMIRWELWKQFGIKSLRRTLREIEEQVDHSRLPEKLILVSCNERIPISVVYFRAGYSPDDYPSEQEWNARKIIEWSDSIKCPSLGLHLVGMKKIQQVLSEPGEVEQFLQDRPEDAALVRSCFAEQHSMEPSVQQFAVELAQAHPNDYVLKPQREGGGNNLYGDRMLQLINRASKEELSGYVLMKLLRPKDYSNYLVRNGVASFGKCISELGIFGIFLSSDDNELIINRSMGHLLRTKWTRQEDGGVAAGNAFLDSPLLTS